MKGYIAVTFLAIYAVYVIGERCHSVSDCVATLCDTNSSHIVCDGDRCVCDLNGVKCVDQATCSAIGNCHKHEEHYHCLDGECVCLKDDSLPGHGH